MAHRGRGRSLVPGVYLPADKSDAARRAALLGQLAQAIRERPERPHVIVGDFNLAPTPADGLYGGNPSPWTSKREREALDALIIAGRLVDSTREPGTAVGFTFERLIHKRLSQFRC